MEWFTTTILISQLTGGDDRAWDLLVQRFKRPILVIAARAELSPEAADDVVQETMLGLVASLKDGSYSRAKGRFSSWLYGIAKIKVLQAKDLARRRRTDALGGGDSSAPVDRIDEKSLLDGWEGSWAQNVLEEGLRRVRSEFDSKTYAAFEAVCLGDEPVAETAARLDMTTNAVAIAKHRVLSRLRKLRDEFECV